MRIAAGGSAHAPAVGQIHAHRQAAMRALRQQSGQVTIERFFSKRRAVEKY